MRCEQVNKRSSMARLIFCSIFVLTVLQVVVVLGSKELVVVKIDPNDIWKRNDCAIPLPDQINLACPTKRVVRLTRAKFARRLCQTKLPDTCATNITLAPQLCDGKERCILTSAHLKAENCGLTTRDKSFIELSYTCVRGPASSSTWIALLVVGVVVACLFILTCAVIMLWRRTKSLKSLAKRQTLDLQRAASTSMSHLNYLPKGTLKTSFTNHEYDLDDNIPVTPYSVEEHAPEAAHEYAEVEQLRGSDQGSVRAKCPTPRGSTGGEGSVHPAYLPLCSDSVSSSGYTSCNEQSDVIRHYDVPKPREPGRGYADMNRGSRLLRPPAETPVNTHVRNSLTPGYVRADDVISDKEEKGGDRRSKTDGYYLASDFMSEKTHM